MLLTSQPLPTRRATIALGKQLASLLQPSDLVVFVGGLGAGKTFLIRALLRALGLPETVAVRSPSFSLVHEYPRSEGGLRIDVIHADLYRLLGSDNQDLDEELVGLGLRERRTEGAVLLVEWGLEAFDALGADGLIVNLVAERTMEKPTRQAILEAEGPRGLALAEQLTTREFT